ncbi:unnamed protein product [Nippostrongylus brasiliensis]|uniref:C2 domain-containing protein n=1 Tax=Nippostrongylus brasiliensis TaxID=27835 RepID=A0A0N4Y706_NIPBR|nr:unnamed protein product [Nippostrongylus brasiliensis]
MLVPVCCDRLPVRLEVAVVSAKGLPIMNKSINSTDAFVEVRFADEVQKTEVVTSLNPHWDSDLFPFDTDEKQLSECWVQFRVMDHDTYSANDAIGRVNLDGNILVEKMRMQELERLDETYVLPIYDTLNGGFEEYSSRLFVLLLCIVLIKLSITSSDFNQVQDPDYEWLDRIRTPRATNEARQSAIRDALRCAAVSLAHKVNKHQCNLICGYQEYLDVEGSATDLFTVRVLGTALRIERAKSAGEDSQCGVGAIVAVRAVHVLEGDDEDPEAVRKSWWNELRAECYQQAVAAGCNIVLAYSEQFTVNDGIALLGCSGTAVVMNRDEEPNVLKGAFTVETDRSEKKCKDTRDKRAESVARHPIVCSQFHSPTIVGRAPPFDVSSQICSTCKSATVNDFLMSTTTCPAPHYLLGPKLFVQVSVTKKITAGPDDAEEYATEVSNVLPFADHDLYNNLVGEAKSLNPHGNAVFDIHCTYSLSDSTLVCVITGVLVRLICLPRDASVSPSLSNVLSFTNLQRYNDARRFSWGTVREAIRFKPSVAPNISLKILNLKPPNSDFDEATKNRHRLNTFVGKIRRRQHEKEYMSHVVFERHLSTSIGLLDPTTACNSGGIAGVHISPNLSNTLSTKDKGEHTKILTRWSDVFIREDLTNTIKDSQSVDGFVTNALDERISMAKCMVSVGGGGSHSGGSMGNGCRFGSALSCLRIASPQFSVSKEHAHMIMLMSCDVNYYD